MTNTHDYLVQMINYAVLMSHTGEYKYGLQILDRVWEYVDESDTSFDYAVYLEAYGSLYLCLNEKDKAKSCFTESLRIYSNIYTDAPALIEEKVKEINLWYQVQGLPDFQA